MDFIAVDLIEPGPIDDTIHKMDLIFMDPINPKLENINFGKLNINYIKKNDAIN